jgi:hypothetical protein
MSCQTDSGRVMGMRAMPGAREIEAAGDGIVSGAMGRPAEGRSARARDDETLWEDTGKSQRCWGLPMQDFA